MSHVLRAIAGHPKDIRRLQQRVRSIEYYAPGEAGAGDLGMWLAEGEGPCLHRRHFWRGPGRIKLARGVWRLPWSDLVATIAHEFGHAVARAREVTSRQRWDDEWGSELTADYHAFRWGFEREIRHHAHHRRLSHHGPLPGEVVVENEGGEDEIELRCDARFYLRPHGRRTRDRLVAHRVEVAARVKQLGMGRFGEDAEKDERDGTSR